MRVNKKQRKCSPILSFTSQLDMTSEIVLSFCDLGEAAMHRRHIGLFLKPLKNTPVSFNAQKALRPTKYATIYEVLNMRGTVYGFIFSVAEDRYKLVDNVLYVYGDKCGGDFVTHPYSSEKVNFGLYTDSCDNLIVNPLGCPYDHRVVTVED